ncbi:MAG: EamA family transporter [bacterium]|nr:EamA family transporter [bacterium]
MEVLLGVGVAAGFGFSDFIGGTASRRSGPLRSVTGVQLTGAAIIGIYLLAASAPLGGVRETVLAVIAGASLAIGGGCMYAGLSWGRMSVMAPVAAAAMAVITFTVGLVRGERPAALALAGVLLAIVAVVLISRPPRAADVRLGEAGAQRRIGLGGELALSLAAGAGFAGFQTTLGEIGGAAGFAPLLVVRAVGGTLMMLILAAAWHRAGNPRLRAPRRSTLVPVTVAGLLLLVAHALLIEALSRGLLSVVGPITSLSPAFTVIPARVFLHKHISRMQIVGLVLATAGLVLAALG